MDHGPNEPADLDDDSSEGRSPSSTPNFDVTVLLGKRDSELDLVFARQIAEVLFGATAPHPDSAAQTQMMMHSPDQKPKPLLLALALKTPNLEDLTQISQEIFLALKD